jgi:hypothetical protein
MQKHYYESAGLQRFLIPAGVYGFVLAVQGILWKFFRVGSLIFPLN